MTIENKKTDETAVKDSLPAPICSGRLRQVVINHRSVIYEAWWNDRIACIDSVFRNGIRVRKISDEVAGAIAAKVYE